MYNAEGEMSIACFLAGGGRGEAADGAAGRRTGMAEGGTATKRG